MRPQPAAPSCWWRMAAPPAPPLPPTAAAAAAAAAAATAAASWGRVWPYQILIWSSSLEEPSVSSGVHPL
ncbi:hypothetical protein HPB50_019273 [Hyalomma asiaticum]|uniref:Uncharacterized protein n=1 Tax=Hyalomma asiaticum TaxID=266040 RepID=A0ACB7RVI0_HYAAI|nr:hypothetical protein HPB50_019273 [Hyalomma asiaticum]